MICYQSPDSTTENTDTAVISLPVILMMKLKKNSEDLFEIRLLFLVDLNERGNHKVHNYKRAES